MNKYNFELNAQAEQTLSEQAKLHKKYRDVPEEVKIVEKKVRSKFSFWDAATLILLVVVSIPGIIGLTNQTTGPVILETMKQWLDTALNFVKGIFGM